MQILRGETVDDLANIRGDGVIGEVTMSARVIWIRPTHLTKTLENRLSVAERSSKTELGFRSGCIPGR